MVTTLPAISHFAQPQRKPLLARVRALVNAGLRLAKKAVKYATQRRQRRGVYAGALVTLASLNAHTLADIGVRPGGVSEYAAAVAKHPDIDPREVVQRDRA